MKNAKLMRALPELMKNWPCGVLPRSFVAKAPLDDNKGEKEKTLWNSVYSVVKENLWENNKKDKKISENACRFKKKVVPLHRF